MKRVVRWIREKRELIELTAIVLSVLGVFSATFLYFWEIPARNLAAIQGSWDVVTRMEGKSAEGGRVAALLHLKRQRASLKGIVLTGAVMAKLNLSDMDLSLIQLDRVTLSECNFQMTVFFFANLESGKFEDGCIFSNAKIFEANLKSARFNDAKFAHAEISHSIGDRDTFFKDADLSNSTFQNGNFSGSNFDRAIFSGALLDHGNFSGAWFRWVRFDRARMTAVDAPGARFEGASGNRMIFNSGSTLDGARFDKSTFFEVIFDHVSLRNIRAFGVTWQKAIFRNCDLTGADFSSARLNDGIVCECVGSAAAFANAEEKPRELDRCEN